MKFLLNLIEMADEDIDSVIHCIIQYTDQLYSTREITVLCDKGFNSVYAGNAGIHLEKTGKSVLLNYKLRLIIKKYKPDFYVAAHTLRKLPCKQIFLATSLAVSVLQKEDEKSYHKEKKRIKKSLENADATIVFSAMEKKLLIEEFNCKESAVHVIYNMLLPANNPMNNEEKGNVKDTIAGGNEFFIATATKNVTDITVLLKGFSGFKKWQKSGMKLILICQNEAGREALIKLLEYYRFKESVLLVNTSDVEIQKYIAAAYAVVLTQKFDNNFQVLISAMQAGVPVLLPAGSMYYDVAQAAAILFSFGDKADITHKMNQIFREESLRSEFIRKGYQMMDDFDIEDRVADFKKIFSGLS